MTGGKSTEELIKRWKAGKTQPLYLNGHSDSIYCLQFDEHKFICGSVWDMHTLECRLVIGPEVLLDGYMLVDEDSSPVHYATGPDNQKTSLSIPKAVFFPELHKALVLYLQYDDEILVMGSSNSICILYDIKSGYRTVRHLRHHTAAVLDLAVDKRKIVTCSKDMSICVWNRETVALLRQLCGHTGPVNALQKLRHGHQSVGHGDGPPALGLSAVDPKILIMDFGAEVKGVEKLESGVATLSSGISNDISGFVSEVIG